MPPFIMSMTREEAAERPGNLAMNQIFLRFTAPRCRLRLQQRRVLRFALEGTPDNQIAEILNIAPRTLKKRWAEIYAAMEPATGILPGLGTGQRGTEIRRHALRYVRDHPEELHAYSA
jgi:DNA-binding NarL/FixJ family response regulator